jgi:outer membrane protein
VERLAKGQRLFHLGCCRAHAGCLEGSPSTGGLWRFAARGFANMMFDMLKTSVVFVGLVVAMAGRASAQPPSASVTDAIEVALSQNPEVLRSREQIREFDLRVRAVRAEALPSLELTGVAQRTRDPGLRNSPFFSRLGGGEPLPPGALSAFYFGTYYYQVELQQTLYHFGRVSHALEAARQESSGVQADVQSVENRVALDVALAYYDLQLARERRQVLDAELETRERQLQQVSDQLELGEATRLDQLQAQVALANLRPEALAADNEIRVALTRLNETMGRPPLEPFEPAGGLEIESAQPVLPDVQGLVRIASRNRPELRRFELNRRFLDEAEGVTRSDVLPEISARATFGINSFKPDNLVRPAFHNWSLGVNVRWTLFDGNRASATVGQYQSQRRQSQLEEQAFLARLARDLELASGEWQRALETADVAALAVEQAREARRVAEELFGLGAATFLDVLDSERALRQAELVRIQADHLALSALAQVKNLIGVRPDAPNSSLTPPPAQADASPVAAAALWPR